MTRAIALLLALVPFGCQAGEGWFGRWDLAVRSETEEKGGWLELAKFEGKARLRVVGRVGGPKLIPEFQLEGNRLRFYLQDWFGRYERVDYDLLLERGAIRGSAVRETGGRMVVTGERAPALARPVPKAWGEPIHLLDSFSRWRPTGTKPGNWKLAGGVLSNPAKGPNIRTVAEFQDFKLNLEFRCPAESNSGVFLRGRYEIQIEAMEKSGPLHSTGAVYGSIAPRVALPKRPDEWRRMEITLVGRTLTVVLDGTTIIEREEVPGPTNGAFNSREAEPGPIVLQGDHGPVAFGNIVLTPAAGF